MGLGKLFRFKRSKPKEDISKKKKDAPVQKQEIEAPKNNDANIVYPFHDVKATSFPPPLSIDASVYTDSKNLIVTPSEDEKEPESPDKNGKQVLQEDEKAKENKTEDDKKRYSFEHEVCDSKICAKEKCASETCGKGRNNGTHGDTTSKKQNDATDKIGQDKLTEMINNSIKEAMQTIVKQCRMDEETGQDEKLKGDDKLICHTKGKYEYRSRQRSPKGGLKPSHFRKKHDSVRSKRLHEGKVKCRDKKGIEIEEARSKKRSKLAGDLRTDNRRMTGNVNIYICSETNENSQPSKSKKPQQPCTESSSETTTDRSNVSSSKLVTCIRNKRRKFKEQNSLDLLPKKDESSDNSNVFSLVAKSTDSNIATGEESNDFIQVCKEISEKDTESSLTECECKDTSNSDATINTSDQSFRKSKFIVCNNIEKPCSTIYPSKIRSKSNSDEWSSKSVCSSQNGSLSRQPEIVVCDKKRGQLGFNYSNHYSNLKEDYETKRKFIKVCACRKENRESVGDVRCICGEKRRKVMEKENFGQPLSTCSCIAEEEEEDVCIDVETRKKLTEDSLSVCGDASEGLEGPAEQFVTCTGKSMEELKKEKERIDEDAKTKEAEEEKEDLQPVPVPPLSPQKLIRPEVVVLKSILRQQTKPTAQTINRINTNPGPVTETNPSENKTNPSENKINPSENKTNPSNNNPNNPGTKTEPAFLKKFNLREQYKFMKGTNVEEGQTPSPKPEDKVSEVKENEEDKDTRKSFQERVKNTFLFKSLKKVLEKRESPERKSEKDKGNDKVGEDTKDSTDKKTEPPKTSSDGDQLSDSKGTKEKEKYVPRINLYKMMKTKKNKPDANVVAAQKIADNADSKPVESMKIEEEKKATKKEETSNVIPEKEGKSELSTTITDNKTSPPPIKYTKPEETKQIDSQKSQKVFEHQEPAPPKDTKIPKNLNDKERKEPEVKKSVAEDKTIKVDPYSEAPIVCIQCLRRKSLNKECAQIHVSEPHTTCVNAKFLRCTDINENYPMDNERFDEGRCNCCCLPISQCTNEFINHPKSCLKKDRQFSCPNSQETNGPILCYDKRNWEGCGCRRVLLCEGCRRPRTECSCRITYVPCANCCKPRSKCSCKSICKSRSTCGHRKSMFCLYCDSPREKCTCRAPLRKCSHCESPMDLCRCEDRRTICDGRPVLTEADNDRTMYVTAWKPREEIRRYFSRNLDVLRTDSINECWCHEKLKHHESDDLPYQRLSVFSDVMDELQQKLSESTCCTRCRKIPCCCDANEGKIKCCVSPKTRRKLVAVCMEKPKAKSLNNYKRDTVKEKSDRPRKIIVSLCCECKSTPCRCKKSKSNQKKPRAKCYYCKSSPCVCIATGECNKPRPCRCNDSPCRAKEKENALRGKTSTKPKNNDEKIICVR